MDGDVDAGEVQHRRQDGPHGDGAVGLAGELCHQEGCGAHDGGHDLAAGGGSRLHGAGELRLVARLLHHGDGDGAGGDGVAHGGAGHHAAQGGGDDGHFGGAAGGGTGHGIGQVDEELGDAGPLQEGAEDDEHHDELGAHADGAAEDAVEGVEHGADDLIEGHLEICTAAQVEEGVHQQHTGHAQDRQAHAPAAQLHQGQDTDEADNHVQVVLHDPGGHLDHVLGIDGVEKVGAGPGNQQHDVIPGHVVDPLVPFFGREGQEAEQQDQPHEHGQPNLLPGGKEHSVDDAVGGERYHQPADHQLRQTLPDPGVGLPVVFFHDRLHIGGGPHGGIVGAGILRRHRLRLVFLEQCHRVPSHFARYLPGRDRPEVKELRRRFRRSSRSGSA